MLQASVSLAFWLLLGIPGNVPVPVSLAGSAESMERQHRVAVESGYEFLRRPADVTRAVDGGRLVPLKANEALALKHPRESVARAEVKLFLESFAAEMRSSCGDRLVVTSLTRPLSEQPRNAHRLSVHPAGMAIDLRVPSRRACRQWLESALLDLEEKGVLDATRERAPAHYHIALFPDQYLAHAGLDGPRTVEVVARTPSVAPVAPPIGYAAPR